MNDRLTVSPDRIMEILQRDPIGAMALRAAVSEATCEVLQARIEQLERQQNPAAERP